MRKDYGRFGVFSKDNSKIIMIRFTLRKMYVQNLQKQNKCSIFQFRKEEIESMWPKNSGNIIHVEQTNLLAHAMCLHLLF